MPGIDWREDMLPKLPKAPAKDAWHGFAADFRGRFAYFCQIAGERCLAWIGGGTELGGGASNVAMEGQARGRLRMELTTDAQRRGAGWIHRQQRSEDA